MRAFGRSCGRRSRSQLTPLLAVHVFSQCPLRPCTATMLESGQLCEGRTGGKAYSTIGLVPSHTTCRPWTTVAAGSADDEVPENSTGVCLCISACETKAACETHFRLALLRAEAQEPFHRVDQGHQICGVERRTRSCIVRKGCPYGLREAELHSGCGMLAVEAMVVPGRCCRWLLVAQPTQPSLPTHEPALSGMLPQATVRFLCRPRPTSPRTAFMLYIPARSYNHDSTLRGLVDIDMAPNLAASQHDCIRDMILDETLTTAQMATDAGCSERSIKAIKSDLRHFSSTRAPPNGVGRPRSITPPMLDAVCDLLSEKPGLYQEEMAVFLWDEFDLLVSTFSISRSLSYERLYIQTCPARACRSMP
jgi:hypothetical protein